MHFAEELTKITLTRRVFAQTRVQGYWDGLNYYLKIVTVKRFSKLTDGNYLRGP
jgi:hypothetical protein